MKLVDLKKQVPPKALYHYTSQIGLIGIISTCELWASKIHYMNDSNEFSLALDLTSKELKTRIENEISEKELPRLKTLLCLIETITQINICVCSLSELGDSLSQWRGYTGGGAGFSIGFATEPLKNFADEAGFTLSPCVYDTKNQLELIHDLIDKTLASEFTTLYSYNIHEDLNSQKIGGGFTAELAQLAPLIKDASFSDEREWRLISNPITVIELDYRPGKSMIIPYYRLKIGNSNYNDFIKEIVIGPAPNPALSHSSVKSLLYSMQMTKTQTMADIPNVIITDIPYRNW